MAITGNMVKDVLKTLPIGYYIGREVKVETDDSMTSHYDIMNDIIRINDQDVADAVQKTTENHSEYVEKDTRAMLYHELSHAMLTPKSLKPTFETNVVEDARIESINRDYFMGVDFEDFDRRYLADTPCNCAENAFIRFCKLGESPNPSNPEFDALQKDLQDLIQYYSIDRLNATTEYSDDYANNCETLFWRFKSAYSRDLQNQEQNDANNQNSNSNGSNNSSDQNNQSGDSSNQNQDNADDSNEKEKGSTKLNGEDETSGAIDVQFDESNSDKPQRGDFELHREKIKSITKVYEDKSFRDRLSVILSNYKKTSSSNASAISAYSGVFDTRSAALREDYRYWSQKNRQGNFRAFSKVHFNLFLDRSSSFHNNEDTARSILKSLCWLEKQIPDFDFTLITCGIGERIEPKQDFQYKARGGTNLSAQIFDTFKQVQEKNALNFNILLYDGSAIDKYVGKNQDGYEGNFEAFNTTNTIIITDPENASAVLKYCPRAHKIISQNYTKELKDNILNTLGTLLK